MTHTVNIIFEVFTAIACTVAAAILTVPQL